MATVYSLICWGGNTGKTITSFNSTTDVITLADHGLHTGTPVSPTTTVSGVTAGTVYYPRWISSSTFTLHPSAADAAANTNIVDLTGSTTFTLKSNVVANPSSALSAYGLSDLSRWDAGGGSYRIYAGIPAWLSGRASPNALDVEVAEIIDAFTEFKSSGAMSVNLACAAIRIESKVNGIRSTAFHEGQPSIAAGNGTEFGYVLDINGSMGSASALTLAAYNTIVDGITMRQTTSFGVYSLLAQSKAGNVVRNCIFKGYSSAVGECIYVTAALSVIEYNLCLYGNIGIEIANNQAGVKIRNNTVSRAGTGFYGGTALYGFYYNNIAVGNTTDWNTPSLTNVEGAGYNARVSGSAWYKGTDTTVLAATTDYADYANHDYSPAASTSPQVDAGVTLYESRESDIADDLVPSYDGSSMATSIVDIGCYEFDLGNGPPPASQDYTVTGVTLGRIKIAKQSDGTEIYNDTTLPSAEPSTFSINTPVYIYIRKGSAAPYYHPLKLSATIDVEGGLDYDATGLQQEDIAAHDYSATAVATDWSFNLATGAITHDSGTTRYSVQDLYSWHQDYTDGSTQIDDDPLMHGTTPTIFELINGGDISDADMEDLYGGSIEFPDGTLWTNLWTTDTMAAAHSVYVVQSGSKYTAFWSAGPIDVLLQVSDAGVLRDSGLVDVCARAYGYTYAYYQADLSAGGRVVAPLATLEDATTQAISSATAAGYTDVGYTFGSTSQDLGEGGGAATYYCRIDCAGRTLEQVFARTMYDTRDVSTTTLNGASGWKYRKAHSSYVANDAAPFGNYSGGFWNVAQGVWLDNVASADQYNYKLTDHAGTTHQLTLPAGAATATVLDGSRVVLYNTTQDTEIDNVLMSGSTAYSYTITTEADTNDVLTLYVFKEGYEEASAQMIWSGTTQSFVISQETHPYIAALRTELSITDYTTITEFAPDTTGHVYIESDDVDGNSQKARAAIWYNGILTTEGGARYFRGGMTILSTAAFRINVDAVDMLFENVNPTTPLVFTDLTRRLYRSDGTSIIAPTSYSIHNDYSGVPDVVETGVSGLTGPESAQLMALPSASDIVTTAIDGTTTLAESLRLSNAVLGGKVSGAGTGTETFRNLADTKDRLVVTVDSSGNRTAITLDLD